ncbi:MAG: hypothetical protein KGK18_04550, partial [Burkholderiales bacterium]|nr:hypothetical protein [Burkholderiales bacterium]
MRSIERYLLAWIMGALTLGAVLMALVVYLVTLEEMDEVFNANLKNVAQAVLSYHHSGHAPQGGGTPSSPLRADAPDGSEIVTLTWAPDGTRIYVSDARVSVPYSPTEGLSHPHIGDEDWIVYTSVQPNGVAQAAQRVSGRQEMAGEVVAKILPPLLGLVVVIGALLVFALRRGLAPLDDAAGDVAARSAKSLEPIATAEIPRE